MRLSEFKDEKAIEVVADLLVPIGNIVANPANKEAKDSGVIALASAMLKNNAKDAKEILAILADKPIESYTCTAATVLKDMLNVLSDPDLLELFGLQSQTSTSAGSALTNSEAE